MRYYAVKLSTGDDGSGRVGAAFPETPGALIPGAQFCSVIDGGYSRYMNDPSALRFTIQAEMGSVDQVKTQAFLRLYGISIDMIDQAADLTGAHCEVYGGFWPGLDLATMEFLHSGLLFQGSVNGAFGNWENTEMTLDLIVVAGPVKTQDTKGGDGGGESAPASAEAPSRLVARNRSIGRQRNRGPAPIQMDDGGGVGGGLGGMGDIGDALASVMSGGGGLGGTPLNMIHDMKEGMPLGEAAKKTLQDAFKNTKVVSMLKQGMTLPYHDAGFYQNIAQHIAYLRPLAKSLASDKDYPGVSAYPVKDILLLADRSQAYSNVQLDFWDLIGQPTWGGPDTENNSMLVNFTTPMRADIFPGVMVYMPPDTWQGVAPIPGSSNRGFTTTPLSVRERMNFQGPIYVTRVMINGDTRNPDGKSWALSVTGNPQGGASGGDASENDLIMEGVPGSDPGGPGTGAPGAPQRLMRRQRRRGVR